MLNSIKNAIKKRKRASSFYHVVLSQCLAFYILFTFTWFILYNTEAFLIVQKDFIIKI